MHERLNDIRHGCGVKSLSVFLLLLPLLPRMTKVLVVMVFPSLKETLFFVLVVIVTIVIVKVLWREDVIS